MCTTISSFRQEGGERERREAWGKKKEILVKEKH